MKKVLFLILTFTCITILNVPPAISSVAETYYAEAMVSLKGDSNSKPFTIQLINYGGCQFNEKTKKAFSMGLSEDKPVELSSKQVLKNALPRYGEIFLYSGLTKLNYLPRQLSKRKIEAGGIDRMAFYAAAKESTKRVKTSDITNIKVTSCQNIGTAPIITVASSEIERLKGASVAILSVEHYPEGVVSLVSYNKDYDTPGKLEKLLKDYVKKKHTADKPKTSSWWYPIYDNEKEFRDKKLPKDVILLIYHVTD
ncbi:MAG: hypothetical protein ACN4E2_04975 [Nitrospinota bacterium]